jgi:hypothetical protein
MLPSGSSSPIHLPSDAAAALLLSGALRRDMR